MAKCKNIFDNLKSININIYGFNITNIFLIIIGTIISCIGLIRNNQLTVLASKVIGLVIIPFLAFTIFLLINDKTNCINSIFNILYIIIITVTISSIIGYYTESKKIIDEPTTEMMTRIKYESLIIDFIIAILCGIGLALAITKKNIIAMLGIFIVVTIKPALANAGLCYGIATNKYTKNNLEYKKYIDYGNNCMKLLATNVCGLVIGLFVTLYFLC
jgi:uncharacterized hydrophobic protein (TIGR00271 family)